MKEEVKERREYVEWLIEKGIGQIALVKKWMQKYRIPFNDNDIQWSFDKDGYLKSIEITPDREEMIKDFENESLTPEFVKSGIIKISINFPE